MWNKLRTIRDILSKSDNEIRRWLILSAFGFIVTLLCVINYLRTPNTENPSANSINQVTNIPIAVPSLQQSTPPYRTQCIYSTPMVIPIHPGDTLSKLLSAEGIDAGTIKKIELMPQVYNNLQHILPHHTLTITLSPNNSLLNLTYNITPQEELLLTNQGNQLSSEIIDHNLIKKIIWKHLTISHSLYQTLQNEKISTKLAVELFNIFDNEVDFRTLKPNAKLSLLYQVYYKDNKIEKTGDIIAASIENDGKIYNAFRNVDPNGDINYYDSQGHNLKKAFLRAPIHYKYISSPFNLHRYHPILHYTRPHKGVDLAAHIGTPIVASSDGRITFLGWENGYGRVIKIHNSPRYSTVYAHLSRFARGIKKGSHVHEGQLIGYVGMSGLATGPHLHYEFHINGRPVNPMTVKLPSGHPIPGQERHYFVSYAKNLEGELVNNN